MTTSLHLLTQTLFELSQTIVIVVIYELTLMMIVSSPIPMMTSLMTFSLTLLSLKMTTFVAL